MSLPSHLQKYQTRDIGAALSANLGSAMPPHVSIANGRFTLVDASNNELPGAWFDQRIGVFIDACIIDVNEHLSRVYFVGAYDPNAEGVRPDCFSDNGVGPSVTASAPQALSCTPDPTGQFGCKWAVWGSKISQLGKKIPACSQKQKVALLIPGYNIVFLLAIPPNSHGPLREYTEHCKGHGINMADVLTRIYFKADEVGTLCFQGLAYIDEPTAELRQAAWNEKKTNSLVGRTDVPRPGPAMVSGPDPRLQPVTTPYLQTTPGVFVTNPAHVQVAPPVQTHVQPNHNAGMGDLNIPHTQIQPTQAFQQVQQPVQQVQQPGPFASAATAGPSGPSMTNAAQPAGTTSPSEPQQGRRRRRTAAEMQAANGAAPSGQPSPGAAGQTPQAPFPVSTQTGALPGQLDMGPALNAGQPANFGIAQPSDPSNEVKTMLDDFFGGQ